MVRPPSSARWLHLRVEEHPCLNDAVRTLPQLVRQASAIFRNAAKRLVATCLQRGQHPVEQLEVRGRPLEKLRGLRLSRAAELVEAAIEETTTPSRRSIGGGFAPTIRSSASCVRSGGAPASWAHSLTVNPRSTSPPPGYATSPARHGRPRDISTSSC